MQITYESFEYIQETQKVILPLINNMAEAFDRAADFYTKLAEVKTDLYKAEP